MTKYTIYTDGNARGWWIYKIYSYNRLIKKACGEVRKVSTNYSKMIATINGVTECGKINEYGDILVISNLEYLVKGYEEHLDGWVSNNYIGSTGKKIKNVELWMELDRLRQIYSFDLEMGEWRKK